MIGQTCNTGSYQDEHLYFTSPTVLFQKITPKRWELIAKLQEVGKVSICGLARLLGPDIRRVHDDVTALMAENIIERDANVIYIPFAEIHTDISLKTKAA